MIAVHQPYERIAESLNTIRSGVSIREVQPGCGGDTVAIVTSSAPRILENRVELVGKRSGLAERGPSQTYPTEQVPHHPSLAHVCSSRRRRTIISAGFTKDTTCHACDGIPSH